MDPRQPKSYPDMFVPPMNELPATSPATRKRGMLIAFLGLVLSFGQVILSGQTSMIQGSLPGYIETGSPPFVLLGPEALGLSAAPVDLQQMPDGRLLAFGRGELALGDGVRWEVFRQADDDPPVDTMSVAIDQTGDIYTGMSGGFGRIVFGKNGRWRHVLVEKSPAELGNTLTVLTEVSTVGDRWFWAWGSGPIVAWRPGQTAKIVGRLNAAHRVFALGSTVHVSDQSNGALFRLENDAFISVALPNVHYVDQTITSAVPLQDGSTLMGTISIGLLRYDGTTIRPLISQGELSGEHRINDLCDLGHGMLAVALDNVGVVFIDQTGRTLQSLDRSLDNRLSRVKRLVRTSGGALWALLNDGIVRIGFPTRISSFESMVTTGLAFSQPFRHQGRLWLMSDGKAQRGLYNEDHRLVGFEVDTPGPYLTQLVALGDDWIASTHDGIFRHEPTGGWTPLAQGPISPQIRPEPVERDCWLYVAENETGWLRRTGDRYVFERFPQPEMGHAYGSLTDAEGVFWAELGAAKVARVKPTLPKPTVEVLGKEAGVPDGWAQLFTFEGEARINLPNKMLRFDRDTRQFVPDTELLRRVPKLAGAIGRPSGDALGRLWITRPENVHVVDPHSPTKNESVEVVPEGLRPIYFTPQTDGAVWMNEPMRLARFDPSMPGPERVSLTAMITRVELPASGDVLYPVANHIADIPTTDNMLLVHYLAPNLPYGQSVTFEVQLDDVGDRWISTGSTGSITFNHLDAGTHHLRVRPRVGSQIGDEAHLTFAILAPWYRTRLAYGLFGAGALGLIIFAIWLSTYFERREKTHLEELVAIRTLELNSSNRELARQIHETTEKALALRASDDRFRRLSDNAPDIIFRVRLTPEVGYDYVSPAITRITGYLPEDFLADPSFPRKITSPAGSESIYDNAIAKTVPGGVRDVRWIARDGRIVTLEERLSPVYDIDGNLIAIEGIARDITQWVEEQEHRHRLEFQLLQSQKLESVGTLAGGIAHDFNNILTGILGYCELATFAAQGNKESLDHLREIKRAGLRAKDLVTQILTFSRRAESRLAPVNLAVVVREAIKLIRASTPSSIDIQTELEEGVVQADSTQLHQIVVNLCTNGIQAMESGQGTLRIAVKKIPTTFDLGREIPSLPAGPCLRLAVSDTGHGIDEATLARIFDPFFTTKKTGEGTGLGLSIVQGIVANHGGALRVLSEVGKGTTFEIYFAESLTTPEPAKSSTRPPFGGQRSVLVVDDEPSVASFIQASLERFGYRVTVFLDPREAEAAFSDSPGQFEAIITDLTMPHLTGVELIQRARSLGVMIPAVLTSGYNKDMAALPPEVAFRTFLISKPFEGVDLARILAQALNLIPPNPSSKS